MDSSLLVLLDDSVDPALHLGDPGVHAWVARLRAPDAPGDDADLCTRSADGTVEQGTTAVALKLKGFIN